MDIEPTNQPLNNIDLSVIVINLLKGVIYQENDNQLWQALFQLQSRVRDYLAVIGLELVLDEAEGYAFLRSRPETDDENTPKLPRLITRRPLSFPVSLLLALLRKKLAEFDAMGAETRLVLSRDDIVDLVRVFITETNNEARLIDQIDAHINKIVDLGFLRRLTPKNAGNTISSYEVKRILKAFIDATWLAELDERLTAYQNQLLTDQGMASDV